MARNGKVGVHGTDEETGRNKSKAEPYVFPHTKDEFIAKAKPRKVRIQLCDEKGEVIEEQVIVMFPKVMNTGSVGYHSSEKVNLDIGGTITRFQGNLLLIGVNSNPDAKKKKDESAE